MRLVQFNPVGRDGGLNLRITRMRRDVRTESRVPSARSLIKMRKRSGR